MHTLSKSEENMAQKRGETNPSKGWSRIFTFFDLSNTLLDVTMLCKHVLLICEPRHNSQ